ncbi:MAG: carboxypeptidase regulatory-like domain-containing protein [Bryobacterales bacterium]|nr:carboxypeptidase regulatory-like domain-containing protein [Bryobacterales bacterium]
MKTLTRVLIASLAVLGLFAQSDNSYVTGTVKDPTGAVVSNAKVTIKNEDTGFAREVNTNESGLYIATNLPPGYYTVTVEAQGFKKSETTRNKMDAGIPINVSIELSVGAVSESVTVEASVATLQTESGAVGKTVERQQIQNLSLNGRNPIFLAQLKAGVRGGALNGFSFGLTSAGLSINGGRSSDSVITYDGAVGIRTRANGTSIGAADVETVQEVQVLTANYGAEYGRSNNGQVRMVTRSGGRDFHFTAYEYFRNDKLDANSWANNRNNQPRQTRRFNQFGYVIDGPVTIPGKFNTNRDKLFFLWSQEWVRFRQQSSSTQTVPTELMRTGNFSELLNPSTGFFNTARVVNDPTTSTPFAGNIIPASRLSPNGIAFLRTYPTPTPGFRQGTANYFQIRPNPQNQRKDTVSIDYNLSQSQVLRFRHSNYNWEAIDAFRGGFDYAVTDWDRPNKTASLNHVWTVSPTMINEFMIAASVDRVFIDIDRTGNRFARSTRGINYPYLFTEPKEINDKVPTVEIANFASIDGGPYPARSTGPIYQLSNNFTKIAGNHQFKFGAYWERAGQNDFDQINVSGVPGGTNNQNGRFIFADSRGGASSTGVALTNAAMGLFSSYAEIGPRSFTPYRGHLFEFFGQDSWRVNQKLKLEIGFRGSWMNGYFKSLWGNMAVFDPKLYDNARAAVVDRASGNVLSGDRFNGVYIPGTEFPAAGKGRVSAIDSGLYNNLLRGDSYPSDAHLTIMPRFGLAYQLGAKDVLRAGFGGFVSRFGVYDSVFLGGNPPFQPMASVANGIADNPGGATRTAFPQFFMTIDPVLKHPKAYNWNVTYQRQIGFETTIDIGYVGTTGNHLARERDLNQLPVGTTFRPENAGANVNFLRPYKGFAFIPMLEHAGRSEYNALQIEVNRRFKSGFSYGFAYTLSKSYDHASGSRDRLYDSNTDKTVWGKSSFDTRNVAIANFIWDMPFFKNSSSLVRGALGGWQVNGVMQFQTGNPFTVGSGEDLLGIGSTNFIPWNLTSSSTDQPKQFSNSTTDANFWFNPRPGGQAWATRPANGTVANQNRNSVTFNNVGFQNWNAALFKAFQLTERQKLQFRAEFFNWLNHPNWNGVNTDPRSAAFGKVTGKGSERNVQLSLRYSF